MSDEMQNEVEAALRTGRDRPRDQDTIFSELRDLCQKPGAMHEISALNYRDWLVTVDLQEKRVSDDPEHRWSKTKLNKNEFMLLVGLMVQAKDQQPFSSIAPVPEFANKVDALLREFHDCLMIGVVPNFNPDTASFDDTPQAVGLLGREAVYYGAEGFYIHQLKKYARIRYKSDGDWFQKNVGINIRSILEIAEFIADRVNLQMSAVSQMRKAGTVFQNEELSNSFLVSKSEIRKKFGSKADAFLARFSTPAFKANQQFSNAFSVNEVAIAPLIDIGDFVYAANQLRLFESIYESPFYWMIVDPEYMDRAAENRAAFLEKTTAAIFRSVFGPRHVYENVMIDDGSKNTAGEVDVLVVYGEFVIVVQAKSKRLTQKARSGDTDALVKDFHGAIGDPYRQALQCIQLIKNGAKFTTKEGVEIEFPSVPRIFPVVALSDHFPASTMISQTLLECTDGLAPAIWDISVLDCVSRVLPSPVDLIYYLKCRSEVFGSIISDSEFNFLGYHLRAKLVLDQEYSGMLLENDFATLIDDYMIATDLKLQPDRPLGVLERLKYPAVSDIVAKLREGPPDLAAVAFDFFDFSSEGLEGIGRTIISVRNEVKLTGKAIKAFSIRTAHGGITYAVTQKRDDNARRSAQLIGEKHKYDQKQDRWYVIHDCVNTASPIDGLLPLVWPWIENVEEAERSVQVANIFNSRFVDKSKGEF